MAVLKMIAVVLVWMLLFCCAFLWIRRRNTRGMELGLLNKERRVIMEDKDRQEFIEMQERKAANPSFHSAATASFVGADSFGMTGSECEPSSALSFDYPLAQHELDEFNNNRAQELAELNK